MQIRLLSPLLLLFVSFWVSAQDEQYLDLVKARNGQLYEGQIIRYEHESFLTIRLRNGKEITLGMDEVQRTGFQEFSGEIIDPSAEDPAPVESDQPKPFNRKWTTHPGVGVNFGTEQVNDNNFFFGDNTSIVGYSFSVVQAYNFSPQLSLGLGASYTLFNQDRKERVGALYGQLRGALSKNIITPILQLEVGYSVPIGSRDIQLIERQGNVHFHPSVGVKFGRTERQPEIMIDLGYRFLDTEYTFESFRGLETRRNAYRRFFIRMITSI
ncbi:MAG: hypothetical protein AAF828_11485 [Bacteroidota bacterium]